MHARSMGLAHVHLVEVLSVLEHWSPAIFATILARLARCTVGRLTGSTTRAILFARWMISVGRVPRLAPMVMAEPAKQG